MQTGSEISLSRQTGGQYIIQEMNTDKCVRKKILFVIDTLEMGGAEQSLLDNIARFKITEPIVCHLYKGDFLKPRFVDNGIKVYSVSLEAKYGFYPAYRKLKEIVEKERPDMIAAYLTRSEIIARFVAHQTKTPVIGTFVSDLYGKMYNQNLSYWSKLAVSFFRLLNKATARYCSGFIANSQAIKISNARRLGIPPDKVEVINRGRDSKQFIYRERLIPEEKKVRFLTIGRLVPVKGQRTLILAFENFLKKYPLAQLHIVGNGPERESLSGLIKELGMENNIILLGNRNDVPDLIQNYDCFVFPSYSEGFSGAVVEAMMTGLPVLASDIPANREVITHLETGYLFEAGSVESISNALQWYTDNRIISAQFADHAYTYAIQHFELENIASKLETYLCTKMACIT